MNIIIEESEGQGYSMPTGNNGLINASGDPNADLLTKDDRKSSGDTLQVSAYFGQNN